MRRTLVVVLLGMLLLMVGAPSASAAQLALPGVDCKSSPVPEVPGRGVVGFFESAPDPLPAPGDPFAPNSTTSIYEQYGYAGLRWNTYDLGCGPDITRSPDAVLGTAVANWIFALPKAAVAATGATLGAAFKPDFLGVFDPLIAKVVDILRRTVFERWAFLVVAALGVMIIWKARAGSFSSTTSAIGWALLVMVLVTMIGRWPVLASHAADQAVTSTIGAVTSGLNDRLPGAQGDAGTEATAGMHNALLYQAWLGGTFGDTHSDVAQKYGPAIFDATALTWAEAKTLHDDPDAGKAIIEAKQKKFGDTAALIQEQDPDAYAYLTGQRSDTRVGYAMLAGLATLCAVPFLFVAGLLVLGALIIVRFGVMLFPAFATLGMFPTMRHLVIGIGNTMAAALINAIVFGIGASVTVLGMGVLLAPSTGTPPWLDIILMLLLTIVMWCALRPFRRLTQMVGQGDHFRDAMGAPSATGRGMLRLGRRAAGAALTAATAGATAGTVAAHIEDDEPPTVPQRAEANATVYRPAIQAAQTPPVISGTVESVQDQRPQPAPSARPEATPSEAPAGRFESANQSPTIHRVTSLGHEDPDMAELEALLKEEAQR